MAFNGTEGRMIPRNEARQLMDDYQNSPAFPANNHVEGLLFGKAHVAQILEQEGCVGIRIYYGKEGVLPEGPPQLIIVGTDEEGNDMSEGLILDTGLPCPSYCSSQSTKL